ncbi:phosphotransferase family protein [Jatrophihabitans sp. YIM 134969]
MASLPGLDLDAVAAWLDTERPGLRAGELSGAVIAGGKSNLTYRVTDGEHVWAVRRPPLAHVLPTAHDMAREYRVITALAPTDVAVPGTVALCTDVEVVGAPFYVMEFAEGVLFDIPARTEALDRAGAHRCGERLVDMLVRLHAVDPAAVGLADFGRPEGFAARQLKRWKQQWDASVTRELPVVDDVVARLAERLPTGGDGTIVHGDYRLTNVLMTPDAERVTAVLDWEMASLGDPLMDVGLLVVYHRMAAGPNELMPVMRSEDGFLTGDELAALYGERSGRVVDPWYVAFGYFKLAVISEGIHARFLQGKTVGEGFAHMGERVPPLLHSALEELS